MFPRSPRLVAGAFFLRYRRAGFAANCIASHLSRLGSPAAIHCSTSLRRNRRQRGPSVCGAGPSVPTRRIAKACAMDTLSISASCRQVRSSGSVSVAVVIVVSVNDCTRRYRRSTRMQAKRPDFCRSTLEFQAITIASEGTYTHSHTFVVPERAFRVVVDGAPGASEMCRVHRHMPPATVFG